MAPGEEDRRLYESVARFAAPIVLAVTLTPRVWGQAATAVAIEKPTPLTLNTTVTAEIETGESHDYRLVAAGGGFVKLIVEQRGIDLAVGLVESGGRVTLSVNACHQDVCSERLVARIGSESEYFIRVGATESAKRRGHYTIRFVEAHAATEQDSARVDAERAYERGCELTQRRLPGVYDEALRTFSNALATFKTVGDRQGELHTMIEIAGIQSELGRGAESLSLAKDAERLARDVGDASLAPAIHRQGGAFLRLGDLPAALKAFGDAAAAAQAVGDRKFEAFAANDQATIYGRMGDAEQAIERSEYALQLMKAVGYSGIDAALWNNIGISYKNLGQFQKSLDAYAEALERLRPGRDSDARIVILNNMGNLERLLGRPAQALPLHEQALTLARQAGSRDQEARSLNTIGLTHYALGDYQSALDYHVRALAIRQETNDLAGQGASLNGQAKALHKLSESARAVDILNEALALRRRINDPYGELDSLSDLAVIERDRGNLATAIEHVRAAVNLEETLRARITSPDVRTTFRAAEEDKYELFIDLLQQAHAKDPGGGHDHEALTISERARSRVLLESLLDARVDLREGIEPALLERERRLQKQLSDTSSQLSRALARAGVDGTQALSKRFDDLNQQYEDVEADIRRQSPRYAAIMQPHPATAVEIQNTALDDDIVLLEFALGEERSWLFALTRDGLTSAELPPRRTIDAAARAFYDRLSARQHQRGEIPEAHQRRVAAADAALPKTGQTISEMLLAGIADRLAGEWRSKRLAIVPSGSLDSLPFGALPLPGGAKTPRTAPVRLGDRHEIVTIPSASVLLALRQDTAGRQPARRSVAMFADPVFDASDPRVTQKRLASVRNPLTRLPFSRQEAASIAAIAKAADPEGVLLATDFAASRSAVLDPAIGDYRILHIATHGIVDTERPAQTALIFSLLDERGETRDGYVRMGDIYNLRLGADLVVLSACQTALGTAFKGEGLIGLARAFMYAGAPRIVASLWEVSDVATAELMTRFYRLMLQENQRPAAALRAAQREMAKDPRWASPYFWGGFVIQGDWR